MHLLQTGSSFASWYPVVEFVEVLQPELGIEPIVLPTVNKATADISYDPPDHAYLDTDRERSGVSVSFES